MFSFSFLKVKIIKKYFLDVNGEKLENSENTDDLIHCFKSIVHIFKSITNDIIRCIFGYVPLFVGIIALSLSSIAVLCFMKNKIQKTVGYHITMIFSSDADADDMYYKVQPEF